MELDGTRRDPPRTFCHRVNLRHRLEYRQKVNGVLDIRFSLRYWRVFEMGVRLVPFCALLHMELNVHTDNAATCGLTHGLEVSGEVRSNQVGSKSSVTSYLR